MFPSVGFRDAHEWKPRSLNGLWDGKTDRVRGLVFWEHGLYVLCHSPVPRHDGLHVLCFSLRLYLRCYHDGWYVLCHNSWRIADDIRTLGSDMLGSERERDMIPSGLRPVEMLRLPLSCGGGQQLNRKEIKWRFWNLTFLFGVHNTIISDHVQWQPHS